PTDRAISPDASDDTARPGRALPRHAGVGAFASRTEGLAEGARHPRPAEHRAHGARTSQLAAPQPDRGCVRTCFVFAGWMLGHALHLIIGYLSDPILEAELATEMSFQ